MMDFCTSVAPMETMVRASDVVGDEHSPMMESHTDARQGFVDAIIDGCQCCLMEVRRFESCCDACTLQKDHLDVVLTVKLRCRQDDVRRPWA